MVLVREADAPSDTSPPPASIPTAASLQRVLVSKQILEFTIVLFLYGQFDCLGLCVAIFSYRRTDIKRGRVPAYPSSRLACPLS